MDARSVLPRDAGSRPLIDQTVGAAHLRACNAAADTYSQFDGGEARPTPLPSSPAVTRVGTVSSAAVAAGACRFARKVAASLPRLLRYGPVGSNTKPCKGPVSSSSTGGGATVTRRLAALVGPCSSSPREKPRSCPEPSDSKARCCCAKSRPTTSQTPVPGSIESPPSRKRARERARNAARQPLRPLPASTLRQVQEAAGEKRRSDLRGTVRLPRVLQQQELKGSFGATRLAPDTMGSGRHRRYRHVGLPRELL